MSRRRRSERVRDSRPTRRASGGRPTNDAAGAARVPGRTTGGRFVARTSSPVPAAVDTPVHAADTPSAAPALRSLPPSPPIHLPPAAPPTPGATGPTSVERALALASAEHGLLKHEALHLKRCQIGYFGLGIGAAGAVVGLTKDGDAGFAPMIYLGALLVLIPTWRVFFDKAKSITRIVGYYRHLETMLRTGVVPAGYVGWENGLERFRRESERGPAGFGGLAATRSVVTAASRHPSPYWRIVNGSFAALSTAVVAIGIARAALAPTTPAAWGCFGAAWVVAVCVILWSAERTFDAVAELEGGLHAYRSTEACWGYVLAQPA